MVFGFTSLPSLRRYVFRESRATQSVRTSPFEYATGRVFPRGLPAKASLPAWNRCLTFVLANLLLLILVPPMIYLSVQLILGNYDTAKINSQQGAQGSILQNAIRSKDTFGQDCDQVTTTGVQLWFLVNIRVITGLSFAHAKLLDTAWDIVFGQFGRLFHAWILWRFILPQATTRIMEMSGLPYPAVIDLTFSPISAFAMWTSSAAARQVARPAACTILAIMVLLIGHCIAFASLWSVATGYVSPSTEMYQVPDGTFVAPLSESLSLCYSLEAARMPSWNETRSIINGPTLAYVAGTGSQWAARNNTMEIEYFFDILGYVYGQSELHRKISQLIPPQDWPGRIRASQFFLDYAWPQGLQVDNELPVTTGGSALLHLSGALEIMKDRRWGYWPDQWAFSDSNLAASGDFAEWLSLPYNSSLTLHGKQYQFDAPPLNVHKDCYVDDPYTHQGGVCLCYEGKPLTEPVFVNSNAACLSTDKYSWGFSSGITGIALALEACFVLFSYILWMDSRRNSLLVRNHRDGVGEVRNVLDLAARINGDLGPGTESYSEYELRKALALCDLVGHDMNEKGGEVQVGVLSKRVKPRRPTNRNKKKPKSRSSGNGGQNTSMSTSRSTLPQFSAHVPASQVESRS